MARIKIYRPTKLGILGGKNFDEKSVTIKFSSRFCIFKIKKNKQAKIKMKKNPKKDSNAEGQESYSKSLQISSA